MMPKDVLEGGVLVKVVEHHLGQLAFLDLDDDADSFPVGFISDVGDPFEFLLVDELGDALQEPGLVDRVGDFRDDDPLPFAFVAVFDRRFSPDLDDALAVFVSVPDALLIEDIPAGRKIRARDELHDLVEAGVRMLNQVDRPVDDLAQVVRRDVRGHADGDARAAVDEQVRELGRKDLGHGQAFVVIGNEIDGVLFDVRQELPGQLGHADFCVPHGGRRVAVDGAEIALAVDERVAQAEVLGHADQGVVDGDVSVGMIFADDIADDAGRLLVGLVPGRPRLVHGIEDAAVDGLEAVLDIGDGPADDDAHGVIQVGPLHLLFQADNGQVGGRRRELFLGALVLVFIFIHFLNI